MNAKKLALSLITIGIVGVAAFYGTSAFFSDTETSTGNTFAAGAVDLKVKVEEVSAANGDDTFALGDVLNGQAVFNFEDLKPGDDGKAVFTLKVEDNDAWACTAASMDATPENVRIDPEEEAGDTTTGTDEGELQNYLEFAFFADENGNRVYDNGTDAILVGPVSLSSFVSSNWQTLNDATNKYLTYKNTNGPLVRNEEYTVVAMYCFGNFDGSLNCAGAGDDANKAQTDAVSGTVKFYAIQSRNNEQFSCDSLNEPSVTPSPTATISSGQGWSPVDHDTTNGQSASLGGDQEKTQWFAKARNNNANFELALGTDDDVAAGQDTAEATWVADAVETFTLSYDGSGNATFTVAGETPVSFAVGTVDPLARIGINVKAPSGVTTTVDDLSLSVAAPLSTDTVWVTNGTNHLMITGVNLNQAWDLTGSFKFSAVGAAYNQENPAVQFSID